MSNSQNSSYYKRRLGNGSNQFSKLEATGETVADLSDPAISQRLRYTKTELYKTIKDFLGDRPEQYEIAEIITRRADKALRILRDQDENDPLNNFLSDEEIIERNKKLISNIETQWNENVLCLNWCGHPFC